jgi:hypothetical protein
MFNFDTDILIDLTSFILNEVKFKKEYYVLAIKNIIDSVNEGNECIKVKKIKNLIFVINKSSKSILKFIQSISSNFDIKSTIVNDDYKGDFTYNIAKKFKYIVLSSNILSFFAVNQNINQVEDMIVVAFEYGIIEENEIYKTTNVYIDSKKKDKKFYVKNPLLRSEYLLISDMDLIE